MLTLLIASLGFIYYSETHSTRKPTDVTFHEGFVNDIFVINLNNKGCVYNTVSGNKLDFNKSLFIPKNTTFTPECFGKNNQ